MVSSLRCGEMLLQKGLPHAPSQIFLVNRIDHLPNKSLWRSKQNRQHGYLRPISAQSLFHSSFFILHSSLFTLHSSLFIIHSSLFTLHSSFFTLHYHFASLREGGGPRSGGRSKRAQNQSILHCTVQLHICHLQPPKNVLLIHRFAVPLPRWGRR